MGAALKKRAGPKASPQPPDYQEQAALKRAALSVPALVALTLLATVWIALHVYELVWWREARAESRALRE